MSWGPASQPQPPGGWTQVARFLVRLWSWFGNYLALDRPLGWRYTVPGTNFPTQQRRLVAMSRWEWQRQDHLPFYLGIALGSLLGHLLLGGSLILTDPHLGNNLIGLLAAYLLYPALHRLGRFEQLSSGWGSLLLAGLYGFVFPVLELVIVG